ncbi:MAG: glycosyltransferase, partial [Cytophagaceae bacterium]|nr:glycosyltransferase [Cytophagaceae bacterium]
KRMTLQWRLMVAYAHRHHADHVLLMYLDQFQVALFTQKAPPCPVSGILFRPTLHYKTFDSIDKPIWKDWLWNWRKRITLQLAFRNRRLHTVFSLDPYSLESLRPFNHNVHVVHLPDPVEVSLVSPEEATALRTANGVDSTRNVLLLFGHLDIRKGLGPLAQALTQLPDTILRQLSIWLVGTLESDQIPYAEAIESLTATRGLQVWRCHSFVSEPFAQVCFAAADGILALYQRHVGMSGILVLAAAAGKPILASDYGLLGELVRRKQLGLAFDTTSPATIAEALTTFTKNPLLGNPEQMRNFASQNRTSEYARVIFGSILVDRSLSVNP